MADYTQEDADRLRAAQLSTAAVQQMTIGGQTWIFRSPAEIQKLLADVEASIDAAAGTSRTRYVVHDKGA